MEKKDREKHEGVDPRGVFFQLMRDKEGFDQTKAQVFDLIFGTRKKEVWKENGEPERFSQMVSILDTGGGKAVDVFPVVSRFQPRPGHLIRCYVVFRKRDTMVKKNGKLIPIKVDVGFAIPVNLREAARNGEWLGVRNNILRLSFRPNRKKDKKIAYVATGPNGKLVLIPTDSGFEPELGEGNYLVSEALNYFVAHAYVPEEDLKEAEKETNGNSLMRMVESVGATLDSVDTFGFFFGGKLFDACEVLGLPATANRNELAKAYRRLAQTEHPDKKEVEFRTMTGLEPSGQDKQIFNYEWSLVEAAKERFELYLTRQEAHKRYLEQGREAQPKLPAQISVKELANRLGQSIPAIRAALKRIGYEVRDGKVRLSQIIALTVVGLFASGEYNPDDLSGEEKSEGEKGEQVDPRLVALANRWGAKINGKPVPSS